MTERVKNIICSVTFILFGTGMFFEAIKIKPLMGRDLGSGFMPKLIAIAIIATAVATLVMALRKHPAQATDKKDTDIKGGLLTIACIAAYVVLYDTLGFLVSTFLYLFTQILILSNDKNRKIPLFFTIAIATSIIVYVLFVYVIGMPLPTGILSF